MTSVRQLWTDMLGGEIRGPDAETVRLLRHKMPAHSSNDAASIILEPGEKRTDFSKRTEDRGKAIVLACRPTSSNYEHSPGSTSTPTPFRRGIAWDEGDFAEFIHP